MGHTYCCFGFRVQFHCMFSFHFFFKKKRLGQSIYLSIADCGLRTLVYIGGVVHETKLS